MPDFVNDIFDPNWIGKWPNHLKWKTTFDIKCDNTFFVAFRLLLPTKSNQAIQKKQVKINYKLNVPRMWILDGGADRGDGEKDRRKNRTQSVDRASRVRMRSH